MKKVILLLTIFTLFLTGSVALAEDTTKLPESYDLRVFGVVPTAVRNQDPWGTCWAFGTMAAIESNYLVRVSNDTPFALSKDIPVSKDIHASEFHLAYFNTKAPAGREYTVFSVTSGDRELVPVSKIVTQGLNFGGNWIRAIAFLSRGWAFGPISNDALPYVKSADQLPLANEKLEDYQPTILRVTDVWSISYPTSKDTDIPAKREKVIPIVKRLIMEHGALYYRYEDANDSRNKEYNSYFCSSNDIARLPKKKHDGHVVAVIGWDDKFPKENFYVKDRELPTIDGAWLIRNSWGDNAPAHEKGYCWISYEQEAEFAVFQVDRPNKNLVCFDWDPLGMCSNWGAGGKSPATAVNVFQAGQFDAPITQISFYTESDDMSFDIYVYTGYGTTKPTAETVQLGTQPVKSGKAQYYGYHTVSIDPQPITANSYFSVGLRIQNGNIVTEAAEKGYSDYARVFDGQSFFLDDNNKWLDGVKVTDDKGRVIPMNACIKAFISADVGYKRPEETEEDKTIDGKAVYLRPADTVNIDDVARANASLDVEEPKAAKVFTFTPLSRDLASLPEGTAVNLTFMYWGDDSSYNVYYNDEVYNDDEGGVRGYMESPGKEYLRTLYPAGYAPQAFVDDYGELFPAYTNSQDYSVKVDSDGTVTVDTKVLPTAETSNLPDGYYEVYYESTGGVVGTFPIIHVATPDPTPTPTPTPTPSGSYGVSSSSGGCNAVSMGLILAGIFVIARKKK